jgi:ferredoxin-NADP reductase
MTNQSLGMSVVSTSSRRPGTLLGRLALPFVDPLVFDFWAGHLNATWSWTETLARIVERRDAAQGFVALVLKPYRHWRGFQPGQHVNVGAEVDGRRLTRSYSLSGAPRADGRIEITVKQVEGGRLSTHLCRSAKVGDVLSLGAAFGDMTLPQAPAGRWVLVAAGSGITPFLSMTRALTAQGMPVDLTLLVWARTRAELCALQELQAIAQQHPRFQLHTVLTREPGAHQSRIDADTLSTLLGPLDTLANAEVRACGPGGFVAAARSLLAPHAKSFQAEAFTPFEAAPADQEEARPVQVTLRRSGRTLTLDNQQALLPALEAQGLSIPSGCRMGICRTCVCTKHAGTAQALDTGDLHTEPESALRLCVSRARTDLTLDL